MRRAIFIAIKDILLVARDRATLVFLLAFPAILIVLTTSALSEWSAGIAKVDCALVVLDRGEVGERLSEELASGGVSNLLHLRPVADESRARALVRSGEIPAAIIVPADLTARVTNGEHASLVVLKDRAGTISADIVQTVASAAATRISAAAIGGGLAQATLDSVAPGMPQQHRLALAQATAETVASQESMDRVRTRLVTWDNKPEYTDLDWFAAALTITFMGYGLMFAAQSLASERTGGTLARMLATPSTRASVIGGKMLGTFAVLFAQFGILYFFGRLLGARWGSVVFGPWLVGATMAFTVTGLGTLVGSVLSSNRAITGTTFGIATVMAILGGSGTSAINFPAWLYPVHWAFPNGWIMDAIMELHGGATIAQLLPRLAVVAAAGLVCAALGAYRLGRR